jgi:glycerol-3-phosphate acyltransferase PlsX
VVVDAMGGDHGPCETVPGALAAHREHGVRVILVGRRREILRELRRSGGAGELEIVHTDDAVPMAVAGARAAGRHGSSLMVGCGLASRERAGFVSAGSTGAARQGEPARPRSRPAAAGSAGAVPREHRGP